MSASDTTRVALVTGAGSGIGRAAALALGAAGFTVVLTGRTASSLEATRDALADAHGGAEAHVVPADVTNEDDVAALFDAVRAGPGRLDVVFNNAGTNIGPATIDEISLADWNTVVGVNLTGAFLVARAAFAQMRAQVPQGGRIINNGSISAYLPRPGSAPYTASKHAISGLTKTIALDGRAFDIACGQIDIGNAASDMTQKMNSGVPQADGSIRPEPTMDVRLVADAVVNMASLPLEANVQNITIMATKMPFVGRG